MLKLCKVFRPNLKISRLTGIGTKYIFKKIYGTFRPKSLKLLQRSKIQEENSKILLEKLSQRNHSKLLPNTFYDVWDYWKIIFTPFRTFLIYVFSLLLFCIFKF